MRVLISLLIALFGAVPQSPALVEADEILAQLSKIRLDKKQIHNIRDVTIRRDALSITFTRGTIAFVEPVMGKVTGAAFIGDGELVAIPPDAIEKHQVHKFTGTPILNEKFQSAIFRFTDNTFEELSKEIAQLAREEVSEEDAARLAEWDALINSRSATLNFRILGDLLESGRRPLFLGTLDGEKTGRFEVVFDSQLAEEVTAFKLQTLAAGTVADIWTSFNQRSEARNPEAVAHESKAPFDVIALDIEAVTSANQIDAKTAVRLKGIIDGTRVLMFDLLRDLRISAVTLDAGEAVAFHRYPFGNAVALVLPRPLNAGQEITLRFAYDGNGGARRLWYPNVGWDDRAIFNVTLNGSAKMLSEVSSFPLFLADNPSYVPDENGPAAMRTYLSQMLGALPYADLKIIQSSNETRNWPGLIETTTNNELTIAQEIARQWFGHRVTAASYRDQWLLEGLSRYLGGMYVESKYKDTSQFREFLEELRVTALESDSAGAIALGQRLANTVTPTGYRAVGSKGTWVIHMLRTMMKDDTSFSSLLRDIVETYGGKTVSTWDFKRLAEKHTGMGLDWFFDQWVFAMGIPAYSLDYKIEPVRGGFVVQGSIKQSDVPDGFTMAVPLYADGQLLGRASAAENDGEFRFTVVKKPERVMLDPNRTVLSR